MPVVYLVLPFPPLFEGFMLFRHLGFIFRLFGHLGFMFGLFDCLCCIAAAILAVFRFRFSGPGVLTESIIYTNEIQMFYLD